ncbi:MAG: hypothetical protein GXP55_04650 [Deltaproteobacteria bacterium]|nr:hypothetical protein [Deltaproteobacteria bacterium]
MRNLWVGALAGLVGLIGCGGGSPPRPGPDASVMVDGSVAMDGSADSGVDTCASDADCDDGVDCTEDSCVPETRVCRHVPVPALCPAGASCNPERGCEAGMACGSDADCVDDDPCTMDERCDPASRTCLRDPLDGDGDGDPPRVCGGTDCDDSNPNVNPDAREVCGNSVDDNCDGTVDETTPDLQCQHERYCGHLAECDASVRFEDCATDARLAALPCSNLPEVATAIGVCADALDCSLDCQNLAIESSCSCTSGTAGSAACPGSFGADFRCIDVTTDVQHCGSCANDCGISLGAVPWVCAAGSCVCAAGGELCGGGCVDPQTDPRNCGGCGITCPGGEFCSAGSCRVSCAEFTCPGGATCGSSANANACGASCAVCAAPVNGTATCSGGSCDFRCDAGYARRGSTCVMESCISIGGNCTAGSGCLGGGCIPETASLIGGGGDQIAGLPGGGTSVSATYWVGGYCSPNIGGTGALTTSCDVRNPRDASCGDCGTCVNLGGGAGLCMQSCTPNLVDNDVCQDGYDCNLVVGACYPGCTSDAQCRVAREESNGIPGLQTPNACSGDSTRPVASQVCGGVDTNFDRLVYDSASAAVCDPATFRCTNPGTSGATAGIPCARSSQCESGGECFTATFGWPGGYCSKRSCDVPGNACAGAGVCQDRRVGVFACLQACSVSAGATTADTAAWLTNTSGCRTGYMCTWNGTGGAGTSNGGCLPGNFNAVTTNNIGAACANDSECWSPFGQGLCLQPAADGSGFRGGYCTVLDCVAPGTPSNVCGAAGTCIDLDGSSGDVTGCMHDCSSATDCRSGYACVDADGAPSTPERICTPNCGVDSDCRTTERCNIPAGTTFGTCVLR